jgi:RND family efflux transporter MFP subunit
VSSELVARVARIPLKAGQSFKVGELLLAFDCSRYEADLRAALAEVKTQEISVASNRQLLSHRAAGANDLALAEAKLAQSVAVSDSLKVKMSQCSVVAPYDGRLVDRIVDVFEIPQPNSPLLKIVKDGALEVDLILPSHWAVHLKSGHQFAFTVDETGSVHGAQLMFLGAVIDPVSRTIKATGKLVEVASDLRPGMSGSAQIVPPSSASRN